MRIFFRKSSITKAQRDRALFAAPIIVALILLSLFTQNKAVLASSWRSPVTMLAGRSPGGRGAGALYNTKPGYEMKAAYVRPGSPGPHERVLAAMRQRPMLPTVADALAPAATPLDLAMGTPASFGDGILPGLGVPAVDTPGARPFLPSSRSGGGGVIPAAEPIPEPSETPDPTPTSTPTAPPTDTNLITPPGSPPISPVPEPATWAMNIIGLFLIGSALRVRNRKYREAGTGSALPLQG
jgi:hypothetical protein